MWKSWIYKWHSCCSTPTWSSVLNMSGIDSRRLIPHAHLTGTAFWLTTWISFGSPISKLQALGIWTDAVSRTGSKTAAWTRHPKHSRFRVWNRTISNQSYMHHPGWPVVTKLTILTIPQIPTPIKLRIRRTYAAHTPKNPAMPRKGIQLSIHRQKRSRKLRFFLGFITIFFLHVFKIFIQTRPFPLRSRKLTLVK